MVAVVGSDQADDDDEVVAVVGSEQEDDEEEW